MEIPESPPENWSAEFIPRESFQHRNPPDHTTVDQHRDNSTEKRTEITGIPAQLFHKPATGSAEFIPREPAPSHPPYADQKNFANLRFFRPPLTEMPPKAGYQSCPSDLRSTKHGVLLLMMIALVRELVLKYSIE